MPTNGSSTTSPDWMPASTRQCLGIFLGERPGPLPVLRRADDPHIGRGLVEHPGGLVRYWRLRASRNSVSVPSCGRSPACWLRLVLATWMAARTFQPVRASSCAIRQRMPGSGFGPAPTPAPPGRSSGRNRLFSVPPRPRPEYRRSGRCTHAAPPPSRPAPRNAAGQPIPNHRPNPLSVAAATLPRPQPAVPAAAGSSRPGPRPSSTPQEPQS